MHGKKRVAVIGAAGYICSQLLPAFRDRYDLVLLDARRTTRDDETVEGVQIVDMLDPDLEAKRSLFRGVDAIVHCGFAWAGRGDDRPAFLVELDNVRMCYHVFELARMEGVPRVVVASSNHAADWYEPLLHSGRMDVVGPETFPLSNNFYGWAKATYEHLGFLYACGSLGVPIQVVMIRIGAPRPLPLARYRDRSRTAYRRDLGAWISERDMQQLFVKSIETPDIRNDHGVPFQVFYGISDNARAFWSIVNARRVIGYAPDDDSEREYSDDIRSFLYGK